MKTIDAKQCTAIALGRLGENDYTVVRFDVSAWITEIPGAVIGLYNQRPGDADAYPIAAIAVEDGVATWTVTSAELTRTGEGKCELVAIAGEVVAKSAIFRTMVFDALDGSGDAPEPWEEWQQQFIILKGEAEQAADRAEEAVEHYPRIVDGVWEVWDAQTGAFISTGVQAQGPQGVPGEQGETGEPGPQGETGPQGQPGQDGAPGADGTTFTPSVSAEGVISWTNNGGKPNPQPVNIKGPQGDTGATGATGPAGPKGDKGDTGAQGAQGIQGATGPKGDPGAAGKDGADGSPGADGADGADGTTYTPVVSAEGVISWTNDGGKPNPQSVNIKGPKGDKGDKGDTGDPGPQGIQGEQGIQGPKGDTGATGATGIDTRTLSIQNSDAIAAGTIKLFRIGTAYTGYTPIGIVSITGSGTSGLVLQEFYLDETNADAVIYYRNATSNAITPSLISVTILYRRN